jgi:hypothetical protein
MWTPKPQVAQWRFDVADYPEDALQPANEVVGVIFHGNQLGDGLPRL